LLAREVVEERSLGQAGFRDDAVQAAALEPVAVELLKSTSENALPGRFGSDGEGRITFVSKLNSITVPLVGKANANDAQLAALEQLSGGGGGGGTSGGQIDAGCQGNWVDDTSDAFPGTPHRVHITVNGGGGSLQLGAASGTLSGSGTFTVTSTSTNGFTATATGNFTSPGGRSLTTFKFQFGCRSDGTARLFNVTDANGQLLDNTIIGIDLVH
jgi:hypothetical protein